MDCETKSCLELGKLYQTADGRVARIIGSNPVTSDGYVERKGKKPLYTCWYTQTGKVRGGRYGNRDLVADNTGRVIFPGNVYIPSDRIPLSNGKSVWKDPGK